MDPITLTAGAILATAGALGAPVGLAAGVPAAAIVGGTFGVPAVAGSVAGSAAVSGPVLADDHARLGVQNGMNDAYNNTMQAATDAYNNGVDAWNEQAVPQLNGAGSTGAGAVPHANFGN